MGNLAKHSFYNITFPLTSNEYKITAFPRLPSPPSTTTNRKGSARERERERERERGRRSPKTREEGRKEGLVSDLVPSAHERPFCGFLDHLLDLLLAQLDPPLGWPLYEQVELSVTILRLPPRGHVHTLGYTHTHRERERERERERNSEEEQQEMKKRSNIKRGRRRGVSFKNGSPE